MMTLNHDAILKAYPNVVVIEGDFAHDGFGNEIIIDPAVVEPLVAGVLEENAYKELRRKRNELLAETDYLGMPDVVMTDEMRSYRQALRDLPANTADPANPTWPIKPV
jgi:hypothetical protein